MKIIKRTVLLLFLLILMIGLLQNEPVTAQEQRNGGITFFPAYKIEFDWNEDEGFMFGWGNTSLFSEVFFVTGKGRLSLAEFLWIYRQYLLQIEIKPYFKRFSSFMVKWGLNLTFPQEIADELYAVQLDFGFPCEKYDSERYIMFYEPNVEFRYSDIVESGLTINVFNSTFLEVKYPTGQTTLNIDPVTFSDPTMTVVAETGKGDTEATAYNFNHLYLADLGGSLQLMPPSTATINMSLTRQVRPADSGALKLTLIITDYSAPRGEVFIEGEDFFGQYQNETVAIDGNGNYETALYYALVYEKGIDATGSYKIEITQPRWGVISRQSERQFTIACFIKLGQLFGMETWFKDSSLQLFFDGITSAEYQSLIYLYDKAHLILGEVTDATIKATKGGVYIIVDPNHAGTYLFKGASTTTTYLELYSCALHSTNRTYIYNLGNAKIWHVTLTENVLFSRVYGDYHDVYIANTQGAVGLFEPSGTVYDVRIEKCDYGLAARYEMTLENIVIKQTTYYEFYSPPDATDNIYLLNTEAENWRFLWGARSTAKWYRQYSFIVNVTDTAGNPINGANVTVSHYGVNAGVDFSVLTGTNGSFATRTLTMGFYNQTGGNTIYSYNPYNITITHPSYETKTFNFTLNNKISWIITLEEPIVEAGFTIGFGSGFILGIMIISALGTVGFYSYSKRRW